MRRKVSTMNEEPGRSVVGRPRGSAFPYTMISPASQWGGVVSRKYGAAERAKGNEEAMRVGIG